MFLDDTAATPLLDTLQLDTSDGITYRSKIAPYLGEALFYFGRQ